MELVKVTKSCFPKKKLFSRSRAVAFKISHKMLNRMERLCKPCSKLVMNTRGYFVTLVRSYRWGHKNSVIYFHFEQLSILPVVFLLLTSKGTLMQISLDVWFNIKTVLYKFRILNAKNFRVYYPRS